MRFQDKVALLTGAGGYIGGECAVYLAREGAKIAVCDINEETMAKTVDRIVTLGGIAKAYRIDVTDSKSVDAVVAEVVKDFGGLDISIHVAGGSARIAGVKPPYPPVVDQTDEAIDTVIKINLYGAIYLARAAARQMIAQNRGGRILSFSSIVGMNGLATLAEYAASKGGVIAFTKSMAKEVGQYGITVNSIAPGIVVRPNEGFQPERATKTNFLNQRCTGEDIAALTAFLASDEAKFITGQTYVCDGGRSLAMKGTDEG